MRDAINRAAERLKCMEASHAVQAHSWRGINNDRADTEALIASVYADAHRILRDETDLRPPTTVPYYEPDDRGFDYGDHHYYGENG